MLYVRMLGSSIKLSLLCRRTSKVQLREIPRVKNLVQKERNAIFDPFLTHAVHIQHVIALEQPIGMKQKRTLSVSTAHKLSNDTNYIWLTSLDMILPYSY